MESLFKKGSEAKINWVQASAEVVTKLVREERLITFLKEPKRTSKRDNYKMIKKYIETIYGFAVYTVYIKNVKYDL